MRPAVPTFLLTALVLITLTQAAHAAFGDQPTLRATESVVRGQTITATAFPAAPSAVAAGFKLIDKHRLDNEMGVPSVDVPFETTFGTGDVWPGRYDLKAWTIDAAGAGSTQSFTQVTVYPLPVMPDFEVSPLVITDSRWLVGLQLHGIPRGARVYVWGQSFAGLNRPTRLRIHEEREGGGTTAFRLTPRLRIQGRPTLIVEVAPASSYKRHGVTVRARVRTGSLYRNGHTRDTVFKSPQRQNFCTAHYGVLKNGSFPPLSSCTVAGA